RDATRGVHGGRVDYRVVVVKWFVGAFRPWLRQRFSGNTEGTSQRIRRRGYTACVLSRVTAAHQRIGMAPNSAATRSPSSSYGQRLIVKAYIARQTRQWLLQLPSDRRAASHLEVAR